MRTIFETIAGSFVLASMVGVPLLLYMVWYM